MKSNNESYTEGFANKVDANEAKRRVILSNLANEAKEFVAKNPDFASIDEIDAKVETSMNTPIKDARDAFIKNQKAAADRARLFNIAGKVALGFVAVATVAMCAYDLKSDGSRIKGLVSMVADMCKSLCNKLPSISLTR